MSAELNLVTQLAIILIAAGIFTIISKALKQPPILGYIIAGFLVGPNLGLFPQFDADAVHQWSELGIIFLMFGLGLEFSFKKLLKIGSSALTTAGTICIGMFIIGMVVGNMMGWTQMESIFLGGMLSMSSTTVIIKSYGDLGLNDKPYAPLIFGTLVFEDLIAVLMMVLLSTLAVTGKFSGGEMLQGIIKLAFFLILWFLTGMYLIPLILKKAKAYLDDEILLVVSIGLCFAMVVFANYAGFSSALGAFVMGSILAETMEGERISKITISVKNLFGAIFFISVGMMVSPSVIAQHWLSILIIAAVAVCGILLLSATGALLAGQGLDTAVHTGFTMAQLGEFSFIIAGLGIQLGVMEHDYIYPMIIATSVLTIFSTPYMIKLGDPVSNWLQKVVPIKLQEKLAPRKTAVKSTRAENNMWGIIIKKSILRVVLYLVITIAIIAVSNSSLEGAVKSTLHVDGALCSLICCIVTLLVMSPFLYLMMTGSKYMDECRDTLIKKNPNNKWPLIALVSIRILIVMWLVIYVIGRYFDLHWWGIFIIVIGIVIFFTATWNSLNKFRTLEDTFLTNFSAKEEMEKRNAPVASKVNERMNEYNILTAKVTIPPDFGFVGKTLREMPFRKTSGVNILKILRGTHSFLIPSGDCLIMPGDTLVAVGTKEQLDKFKATISENTHHVALEEAQKEEFTVDSISVGKDSHLCGQTLKNLGIRHSGCMVISVARGDKFIANPNANFCFQEGDLVWIAGDKANVEWYK